MIVSAPYVFGVAAATYTMRSSHVYCAGSWHSAKLFAAICMLTLALPMCFIAFAYTSIFLRVAKLNRDVKSALEVVDGGGGGIRTLDFGGVTNNGVTSHAVDTARVSRVKRNSLWRIRRISFLITPPEITVLQNVVPTIPAQDRLDKQQMDLLKQSVLIVGTFIIGWTP
ncbi:hypothetical protein HK100_006428, partial [Physocladia obscura]